MDQESYEQIEVDTSIVGETKYWLEGKRYAKCCSGMEKFCDLKHQHL